MIDPKDIKTLQAEGKSPAPCARFCEATAFGIEIAGWKRDQAENLKNQCKLVDQISELTAERDALKDAARLALDALERILYKDCGEPAFFKVREAIAALKAVL